MPDHLPLFFGMRPNQSLSDLMRIVKGDSSEWINNQKWLNKGLSLQDKNNKLILVFYQALAPSGHKKEH